MGLTGNIRRPCLGFRVIILSLLLFSLSKVAVAESIKIGVLAHRGVARAMEAWSPTAKYLTERVSSYQFSIVPLTNDTIDESISRGQVDFILTNPASYASLEARHGISRIATIRNLRSSGAYTHFGALIFTRANRDDIRILSDLEGKTFMAVHPNAFGGWWMAWREILNAGVDPLQSFEEIQFSGFPQDKVVYAVRDGLVDAGTVRTDLLESMERSGLIDQREFKVLNAHTSSEFPFRHSTRLYPEWPIAISRNTPRELAQKVAIALLEMDSTNHAALSANIAGWTVPLDYQSVHELMKELKVGSYVNYGKISFSQVIQQYWLVITLFVTMLILMAIAFLSGARLNRSLQQSKTHLEREIEVRKRAENKSAQLGKLLDESSNEIFVFDCDTLKYIQVNKGACHHLGYTQKELLTRTVLDVLPEYTREKFEDTLKPLRDGESERIMFEAEPQCKDGSRYTAIVWVQMQNMDGSPVFVAVYEDITARKNAEQALFKEKERANVTLMSIGDAVITTDRYGVIEYFNPIAEQMTGYKNVDVKGKNLIDVISLVDAKTHEIIGDPVTRCLREGRFVEQNDNVVLIGEGDKQSPVHQTVTPRRNWDGEIEGVVIVYRDVTELQRLQEEMKYHATHDYLTKLVNRREFQVLLKDTLADRRELKQGVLLYIDLDQFKIINDSCGHAAGDKLLKEVSTIISQSVRGSDIVARLGGDEFAILLRSMNDLTYSLTIATQIIESVNNYQFCWFEKTFHVGVSIGIVFLDENIKVPSDAMAMADSACYVAKDQGRNQYYVYQKDDAAMLRRKGETRWIQRVKYALAHDKYVLYCQPVVSLNNNNSGPDHMEILLRMEDENGELCSPEKFIPAAERYQYMPRIDNWVVENTFKFLSLASNSLKKNTRVSINISGQTLVKIGFVDFIVEKMREYAIPAELIIFEITETAAIENFEIAKQVIEQLKKIGCWFSMDDFGSGMSSFSYLKNLPVDFLKIDGSFVKGIADNYDDYVMVQAISQIGRLMKIKTIAEFAENKEIIDKLMELDIDLVQGYAIGKPVPVEQYIKPNLKSVM